MKFKNVFTLLGLIFLSSAGFAANTYETSTSVLTLPQVKLGDTLYKSVTATLGKVVSVGSLMIPDTYATYNATSNELTMPLVKVGSDTYYNVVVTVGKVLSVGSSCSVSSGCSKVGTPEVKGVTPGDGRISVMFNFMGGKITTLLGTNTNYVAANAYVAICTSSDGQHASSSISSVEYGTDYANYANPVVVSGLINGKSYSCKVSASASDALAATSTASDTVIPNAGSANASAVLSSSVNTAHALAYPSYDAYCNYKNQTATGLPTPATITYYNTAGTVTSGTSSSTITCTSSTRTITGNALPDYVASKFFTNGLTGYTGSPYFSGQPNSIGEKSVSKTVPLSGTISSAYVKGSAGYDTSACYNYTSTKEPGSNSNTKWASGGSVWSSGTVRCHWVAYFSYMNNSVKVEPGTAETYTSSGITYKAVAKNLYQDVGLDPSNSHNQPTMSGTGGPGGSMSMYGYYHLHGMPEGHIARLGKGNKTMTLLGFAVDCFPIYARYGFASPDDASAGVAVMKSNYRIRTPAEMSAAGYAGRPAAALAPYGSFEQDWVFDAARGGNLDACNGRYGVTPESPTIAVYHYFITDSYPFIPRCVFGTPATWANDASMN